MLSFIANLANPGTKTYDSNFLVFFTTKIVITEFVTTELVVTEFYCISITYGSLTDSGNFYLSVECAGFPLWIVGSARWSWVRIPSNAKWKSCQSYASASA